MLYHKNTSDTRYLVINYLRIGKMVTNTTITSKLPIIPDKKCKYICATQKLHVYSQPDGCLINNQE